MALTKWKTLFDNTNPSSTDNDNVGAFLRGGTGDLINDKVISTTNWLQTASALFDGSGTALTSTLTGGKQALDVNIAGDPILLDVNGVYNSSTNPTPNTIGGIYSTRSATPGLTTQTLFVTGATPTASGVTAANISALDVNSFLMGYNGTTWDRLTSTSGALNVNISTESSSLSVQDQANTALAANAVSVTSTAAALVAAPLSNRKFLTIANNGLKTVYVGGSSVTATTGFPVAPGSALDIRLGAAVAIYGVTASGTADTRTLELS